jgi:hypothetical protein
MNNFIYYYCVILLIITCIFIIFNYLLLNNLEFFDLCSLQKKSKKNNNNNNIKSKYNKNIIIGYDKNNNPIIKKITINQYCNLENEFCLVDPKGNNTCCNGLKCIRKVGNYQYKVCSKINENDSNCENKKLGCIYQENNDNYNEDQEDNENNNKYNSYLYSLCGKKKILNNKIIDHNHNKINYSMNKELVFSQPVRSINFN